jgi:eukaryotic-like serine/threonine-protein kinase
MAERYGDFELERLIATGGMAEIYLARHAGFGGLSRHVVVKRMLPQLAVRPDFVQMFLDEARLAANLNHPNIVQVFNLGEVDDSYFIAMEFVEGPHLGSLFAHSLRLRRPLPVEQCAYIVARAADGLHYAHEHSDPLTGTPLHIVHRDISPQNILISRQGDVKVTDFGVAKASTQQTKTRTGIIKGKVAYMSPEQCLGETVDRRSDVFALGIVLYELLTRRRLFRDKSDLLVMQKITGEDVKPASSQNKELDAEIDAICQRALARDREERFSTSSELAEALDAWLTTRGAGDSRARLQHWVEENALDLLLGESAATSLATAAVRPTDPGEATSATPSLSSGDTVLTPAKGSLSGPVPVRDAVSRGRKPARDEQTEPAPLAASSWESLDYPARLPEPPATVPVQGDSMDPSDALDGGDATLQMRASELPLLGGAVVKPAPKLPLAALAGSAAALGLIALVAVVMWGGDAEESPPPAAAGDAASEPDDGATRPDPAAPGALARITVESVPPGVPILLDEERMIGRTPITVEHPAGKATLQAQFSDQPPAIEAIEVAAGEERLVRLFARVPLVVKTNPPKAKVRVDGELLGETPLEKAGVIRPERAVKVRLELPGYSTFEKEITPEAGTPLVVDVLLERPRAEARPAPERKQGFGFLNMRSTPWVNVRLQGNGQKLGSTILAQVRVPAGRQTLVLSNPEVGLNDTLTVVVPEERSLSVTLEWEKKGSDWKIKTKSIK